MKNQPELKKFTEYAIISFIGLIILNLVFAMLPVFWSNMLIGKKSIELSISFQDIMWFFFLIGMLLIRRRTFEIKKLRNYQKNAYLPEDFETIIDDAVLTGIIKSSKKDSSENMGILPYMILQISLQFRTNQSIALTSDFLSKQLELFLHSVELRYNKLKYLIWLIPSLGFMGTVYGIGVAVSQLGQGSLDDPDLLTKMAASLGVAFNTTLLALVLSVILQFFTQHFEAKEENLINDFGKYILDNLINKIIEKKRS